MVTKVIRAVLQYIAINGSVSVKQFDRDNGLAGPDLRAHIAPYVSVAENVITLNDAGHAELAAATE